MTNLNDNEKRKSENLIREMLTTIGENPDREGLVDTPKRIVKSWNELYAGYGMKAKDVLSTTFSAEGADDIVLLKDIEIYSMCEHHNLPFYGKAHIAYIPGDKIVGISKLARLADMYARRMQIQERLGNEITKDIMHILGARGAACVIEATHMCMRMRGVSKQESTMVTSSMKGAFFTSSAARLELLSLIKG